LLFLVIAHARWRKPTWMIAGGAAVFLTIDLAFFSANLIKVPHGGWLPLTIGAAIFTLLSTWQRGREIVTHNRVSEEGPLQAFVEELRGKDPPVFRAPGTGVFLHANPKTTPIAMRANVEHNHVLHESAVILRIEGMPVPHAPRGERISVDDLGYGDDGLLHITARFGYQDPTDIPGALRQAIEEGVECPVDVDHCTYFLSNITIVPTDKPGLARWRKRLFIAISRNAASPVEYFVLPADRTIVMGASVPL
jgi:KUP system potassium uptake protein